MMTYPSAVKRGALLVFAVSMWLPFSGGPRQLK